MLKYGAMGAALLVLAGCAGLAPAGRSAERAPEPAAPVAAPAPVAAQPPPVAAPAPTAPQPPAVQPVPAPAPVEAAAPRTPASGGNDIVVQGQAQARAIAPDGDPRSVDERRADMRSWDQCVMQVQNAFDADPMRPQLTTPEEYCANSLGMADRNALPSGRRRP